MSSSFDTDLESPEVYGGFREDFDELLESFKGMAGPMNFISYLIGVGAAVNLLAGLYFVSQQPLSDQPFMTIGLAAFYLIAAGFGGALARAVNKGATAIGRFETCFGDDERMSLAVEAVKHQRQYWRWTFLFSLIGLSFGAFFVLLVFART